MLTVSEPEGEKPNPLIPINERPLTMEAFEGMNTQATRVGVDDRQCFWIDGFFPIAPRNLRTLYGIGTTIFTVGVGASIVWYDFYNIGTTAYCVAVLTNGVAVQIRISDGAITVILAGSSILNPTIGQFGISQYGHSYLIIVANQTNGYWIWDGSIVYKSGTLGPVVTLTNVGAGYNSSPIVVASGGSGTGATFVATVAGGVVTTVTVTNPGQGYLPGQTVTLVFSGGNSGGTGASLTANLASTGGGTGATFTVTFVNFNSSPPISPHWKIGSVVVTNGGSGYSSFTTLNLTITSSSTAIVTSAVLQPVISGGVITGVTIVNSGDYYRFSPTAPTGTLAASDSGNFHVVSVTIVSGGTGYSASATAVCSGGGSPIQQASLQLIITGGVITGVTVASGGLYGSNTPPTVTVSDPVVNASATVSLMPFGVQGTDVETYQGSVWVINGTNLFFNAPGSVTDFATSDGGGNRQSSDSFLRIAYQRVVSTNGFLFLIGDSCINYISGVQTAGSPPTTTFTNTNADPEVGTPYPSSVIKNGQNLMLANSFGIHEMNGAKALKVSDDLDGVYNTVPNFGGLQLSSAQATIFGKKCQMTLVRIADPISGATVNKLFMRYGKKWFASMQDVALTFVASQEINSVFTAYGTDGTNIYPLFQQPSSAFNKVVQSKLWDTPVGIETTKVSGRLWGMCQYYSGITPNVTFNIDNEDSSSNGYSPGPAYTIAPDSPDGIEVFGPQAIGQQGALTGFTMTTAAADMSLISAMISSIVHDYRG
jgi:hypothetical protein